ncbi:MAG: putative PurR-regulated permease PerM [Flavobacteriales bacterium]
MGKNLRIILTILGVIALIFSMWFFRTILIYILISAVISIVGSPLVKLITRIKIGQWNVPSWLAATITLLIFGGLTMAFLSLFAPLVAQEAALISKVDIDQTWTKLEGKLVEVELWVNQFNLSGDEQSNREFLIGKFKDFVDVSQLSSVFNNVFGLLGNMFIAGFSILFMSFFFLKDGHILSKIIYTLTPDEYVDEMKNILTAAKHHLTKYFVGVLVQITLVTILVSLGLYLLGVQNAIIIGFLAGILNLIPYVGPIIGAFIGILISVTTNLDMDIQSDLLPLIGKVAGVFLAVQLIDNFFTQPIILGNSVQAHPLEIFIVISLAATMAGIPGMIFAIPGYTMLRIVAKEFLSRFKIVQSLTKNL